MLNLSPHFTLRELTRSEYAERNGINNDAPPEVVENLRALCVTILEPIRAVAGKPVSISSGYRSPAVNQAIGGNATGQHPRGEAADFECFGLDNLTLAEKIISMGLPFDQLILEFYVPGNANSGWVHVSHKRLGKNRGEVLTASTVNGKTVYTKGLPERK